MRDYLKYSAIGTGIIRAICLILKYTTMSKRFKEIKKNVNDQKARIEELERIITQGMVWAELAAADIAYRMDAMQRRFPDDALGSAEGELISVKAETLGKILYGNDSRRDQ